MKYLDIFYKIMDFADHTPGYYYLITGEYLYSCKCFTVKGNSHKFEQVHLIDWVVFKGNTKNFIIHQYYPDVRKTDIYFDLDMSNNMFDVRTKETYSEVVYQRYERIKGILK